MYLTNRKSSGFTLSELIGAMVIAAIRAAIAIPAYSNYVRQARRTDAKSALLDMASLEERYFSVNNAYTANPASLGYSGFPQVVGSGYYQVILPVVTPATTTAPATYALEADAVPGSDQMKDQCTQYQLNSVGTQGVGTSAGSITTCWH